jgi:epsilon-lactone hydrolase
MAMSNEIKMVRAFLASLPPFDDLPLAERRTRYDRAKALYPLPAGVAVEAVALGGVAAERVTTPASSPERVVLYLHGGGYVMGSADSHRHVAAGIAEAAAATVLLLCYRVAPEHPFPAAVDDALAAYRSLVEGGHPASRFAIAGDSAGGGLTIATMMAARDAGLPLPAAAALISPWVDLSCSLETITALADRDPIVRRAGLRDSAGLYLAGRDPLTPLASPLFGDLRSLPPLLIQVGSDEILLDDARELDRRAREQGVRSTIEVWPDMIHVWHWFAPRLREGRDATVRLGEFLRSATG